MIKNKKNQIHSRRNFKKETGINTYYIPEERGYDCKLSKAAPIYTSNCYMIK